MENNKGKGNNEEKSKERLNQLLKEMHEMAIESNEDVKRFKKVIKKISELKTTIK